MTRPAFEARSEHGTLLFFDPNEVEAVEAGHFVEQSETITLLRFKSGRYFAIRGDVRTWERQIWPHEPCVVLDRLR